MKSSIAVRTLPASLKQRSGGVCTYRARHISVGAQGVAIAR